MIRRLGQATYGQIGSEGNQSSVIYGKINKAPSSGVSSPSLAPQRTDSRATSSNGSTQQSSQPENQKVQLTAFISHLCGQLRKVVSFVNEIAVETDRDRRHPADLLTDLESKVLPFLMQIDEDMTEMERLIRCNIDSCNINDPDVDWLLSYNKYQIEMRRVWQSLSTNVFADLESVLDTRRRGVLGVSPKEETLENLGAMRIGMDRAMSLIMKESEC